MKKIIAILVVIAALVGAGIGGYAYFTEQAIKNDPVNYMAYSMLESGKYKAISASYSQNYEIKKEFLEESLYSMYNPESMAVYISSLLNGMSIDGNIKMNIDEENEIVKYYQTTDINYEDMPLLEMSYGYDKEIFLMMPQLSEDMIVIGNDLIEDYTGLGLTEIDYWKYVKLLDSEKLQEILTNNPDYLEFVRYEFSSAEIIKDVEIDINGEMIKCDVIKYEMTMEDIMDIYVDLAKLMKKDEELKGFVKEYTLDMVKLAVESGDYQALGLDYNIDSEDLITVIEEEWDTVWEEALDGFVAGFESGVDELEVEIANSTIMMEFAIDADYLLREVKTSTDTNMYTVNQVMTYDAYGDSVTFDEIGENINRVSFNEVYDEIIQGEVAIEETYLYGKINENLKNLVISDAAQKLMEDMSDDIDKLDMDDSAGIVTIIDAYNQMVEYIESEGFDLLIDGQEMFNEIIYGGYDDSYDDSYDDYDYYADSEAYYDFELNDMAVETIVDPEYGSTSYVYLEIKNTGDSNMEIGSSELQVTRENDEIALKDGYITFEPSYIGPGETAYGYGEYTDYENISGIEDDSNLEFDIILNAYETESSSSILDCEVANLEINSEDYYLDFSADITFTNNTGVEYATYYTDIVYAFYDANGKIVKTYGSYLYDDYILAPGESATISIYDSMYDESNYSIISELRVINYTTNW